MPERESNQIIRYIMLAVTVWGGLLALGAYLFGHDPESGRFTVAPNPWRGLIVAACVAGFLGFWAVMLAYRKRSPRDDK